MPMHAPEQIIEIAQRPGSRLMHDIPELPGKVLRRTNIASSASKLALSPSKYVGTAEEHLDWLREEGGLAIPEFTFYLGKRNGWSRLPQAHLWVRHVIRQQDPSDQRLPARMPMVPLYTVVDAIDGHGDRSGNTEWLQDPTIQPHVNPTADALSDYHDWAASQRLFLFDVSAPSQYMFGTSIPQPEAGKRLYMVDVDPHFSRPGETAKYGNTLWQWSLNNLQQWQDLRQ